MKQNTTEPCIFYKFQDGTVLLLLVWVDDVWAAYTKGAREKVFLPWYMTYKQTFKLKLLGEVKLFVGINITRDRQARTITLSQAEYVKNMVKKFLTEHSHVPHQLVRKIWGIAKPYTTFLYQMDLRGSLHNTVRRCGGKAPLGLHDVEEPP